MKRTVSAALIALSLLASTSVSARNLDFQLTNKTGYTINEVYVSSASSSEWEEDVMGRDALPHNSRVNIRFNGNGDGCKWDMKVVYDDGETAEWGGLNLCAVSSVTLFYDHDDGGTWAETE